MDLTDALTRAGLAGRSFGCGAFMLLLLLSGLAPAARATITVGEWAPIFRGVELARGHADAGEPRVQQVTAVRIDLRAPGIQFFSTPSNGDRPRETTSETASEFLARHRLQLAINANFFFPCCEPGDKDLQGLAISRGEIVSPPPHNGRGAAVLLLARDNTATITTADALPPLDAVWTAVAGSELVLVEGRKPTFPAEKFHLTPHPRSAIGLSRDRRYLILMVIDGRQPGHSLGATMDDVADWLRRFGAHDALNLDGGGSAVLVRAGPKGEPIELTRPSGATKPHGDERDLRVAHRAQRSNGNHLGLYAAPLD